VCEVTPTHLILSRFMYIPIGDSTSASILVQRLHKCHEENLFMFFEKHQIQITINYILTNNLNK
jgi:hypothetical protein